MGIILQSLALFAAGAASLGLYALWQLILRPMLSPINKLPGPPNKSFLFGHSLEAHIGDSAAVFTSYEENYGTVVLGIGPLGTRYVVMTDVRGVKEVVTRSMDFVKPYPARTTLSLAIGAGLVVTEGEVHKCQRKLLNICFYPATIKNLTPIFHEQSQELKDVISKAIDKSDDGKPVLDVYHIFLATVLNMIGLAGFNYHFNAHHAGEKPNELHDALEAIYLFDPQNIYMSLLRLAFPDLHRIPSARKTRHTEGLRTFKRVTSALLEQRKKEIFEAESVTVGEKKVDLKGRDLLSALVKANADPSIPNDQRLSDDEVLSQVKTFLVAGHETTATALAWLVFELACNPSVQSKLREEILEFTSNYTSNEDISIDDISALPYLDAVLRESMRLRPAIPYTMRIAKKDDIIPLSKPYTDKDGKVCENLHLRKGDNFVIPIEAMNRSKMLFGEDANEFKPQRWTGGLDTGIPGVWSSLMTFLGGPRSCIGYRFAIYEMKVILLTLLPVFEFELSLPADDIAGMTCISKRPYSKSQLAEKGFQMPIKVKRHVAA